MFHVTSPIVINKPTRGLMAVETMHAIVQWLANLKIKRNMTSMFVNKKHRYMHQLAMISDVKMLLLTGKIGKAYEGRNSFCLNGRRNSRLLKPGAKTSACFLAFFHSQCNAV